MEDSKIEEGKLSKWAENEELDALEGFRSYLEKRRKDISQSWDKVGYLLIKDQYVIGFAQGMRAGLATAEDLVYSYVEQLIRDACQSDEIPSV